MKLHKKLCINEQTIALVSDETRLRLQTPGVAVFTVTATDDLSGLVTLDIGFSPRKMQRYFIGYIESQQQIDTKTRRLFCRELAATVNRPLAVALRHVTLTQCLAAISEHTGVEFITPTATYTKRKVAYCYSMGSGDYLLDSLRVMFDIPKFIWQQQGDGAVYVGSWLDSFWRDKPVELPDKALTHHGVINQAHVAALPALRPGVFIHGRGYLTQVILSGVTMQLRWHSNPWSL